MEKLLLTPTEAASPLGIGRSKLYELMRTGVVSFVRIGGCRRVPAANLSDLVAQLQGDRGGYGATSPCRPQASKASTGCECRPPQAQAR